ncbi:MAG TPA: Lrp/AsnC ligand binding domain-containing protein [Rhodospirillales bacterium]|nr:Lrp/AsnC ligand binding domain-containing protein [Rhodospirillales bacterium]
MKTIFVQIKCELGAAYDVADRIVQCVEEASEIYSTSGTYDLLLKCYLDDGTDIGHFVTERVQRLSGIKDTFTTVAFKAFPVAGGRGG